jgi:uncharacterized protein (TIGR02996 family)
MKHPDWPAFVSSIVALPDDDTLRLVAADFLEENGDAERAAFIRVQVALARLETRELRNSLEADELRKRERAFLGPFSVYPHLWAAEDCPELVRVIPPVRTSSPLASLHVAGVERLGWRRGFVEEVRCPAAEWLRHGAAVRKRNPVRGVLLSGCASISRDAWYAGLEALRGLRQVWVGPVPENERAAELVRWLRGWLPETDVVPPVPF